MRLAQARVTKYRSILDTDWFEVEPDKTIFVGPNEAGKTAVLESLQRINAPGEVKGFDPLRDYPRSQYNDISSGRVDPANVHVVEAVFDLDDADKAAIDSAFHDCRYVYVRRLDNKASHWLQNAPEVPTFGDVSKDLLRLAAHTDGRFAAPATLPDGTPAPPQPTPSERLASVTSGWSAHRTLNDESVAALTQWLDSVVALVDETDATEEDRLDRLRAQVGLADTRAQVLSTLAARRPVFVYFSNYFRVRPNIHLRHLADRIEQGLLDDDQYDFGNQCLLKLLGFTARELSDLGDAPEPPANDTDALKAYRDQLDRRSYMVNAASVRLTNEIRDVWKPSGSAGEEMKVRIRVDQQYLKVVVEDDLGVEVELDQRSEGFQWLVSFFIVFFAEAQDQYDNAILLLDEPGLNLHGLKQRDFRDTISRLAESNQVLYTTHSPFMVGPSELDQVRVVEMTDRAAGTKVHSNVTASDPAALLPLQEALGYDLAQSLFAQQRNLVLEGLTDYWYVEATSALLRDAGLIDLDGRIALNPADGAGKVVYYATILHAQKLKVAALLDSDNAGDQAANQDVLVHTLGNRRILRTKDVYAGGVPRPEIEELLRDTLLLVAKDDLGWDVTAVAASQPDRSIVDIFSDEIADFSKYRLAKAYLRWTRDHVASDLQAVELQQWHSLVELINKALK